MSVFAPLGWSNAILPLAALLALTVGLPMLIGPTLSQGRLAIGVGVTAVAVLVVGAGLMGWAYAGVNDVALFDGGWARAWFLIGRSALMSLLWAPVLALVWLVRAQGVERRRGLLMREGRG